VFPAYGEYFFGDSIIVKSRATVMRRCREPLSMEYIDVEYIDVPELRGDDVEIAGAGVCYSNLHLWRGEMEGFPTPLPMVLGHQNSGVVSAGGRRCRTSSGRDAGFGVRRLVRGRGLVHADRGAATG
jgi:D-arabinose 1-dehydrogenase-like Zn-dependent alcohol dehydrogenase